MADPMIRYKAVSRSDHSDEEAGVESQTRGGGPSSDDRPSQTPSSSAVGPVAVEAASFLERQDSDEYEPSPIQKRCGARVVASVAAGLVLSLALVAACLSQTLGIVASRSPAASPTATTDATPLLSQNHTESSPHKSSSSSSSPSSSQHLADYTWDGKKCFQTNAELRVAIDSYLLDRNNETIEQLYGLPIGKWCVRNIKDFAFAFASEGRKFTFPDRADELRTLMERFNDDITTWDVTGAKSLDRMFRGAKEFNQDLSTWDVSRVESMLGTFEFTQRFDGDIRNWDVSKVKIFTAMFLDADGFGRNLVYWNVSSATDMVSMFRNAGRFNHDMCPWAKVLAANNVTSMQVRGMFLNSGCPDDTMVGPFFGDDPRWSRPGPFCYNCE